MPKIRPLIIAITNLHAKGNNRTKKKFEIVDHSYIHEVGEITKLPIRCLSCQKRPICKKWTILLTTHHGIAKIILHDLLVHAKQDCNIFTRTRWRFYHIIIIIKNGCKLLIKLVKTFDKTNWLFCIIMTKNNACKELNYKNEFENYYTAE